ncbi:unnamed protein product [Didymodactylos carnosus]|nr:unnamed protein product [Didymodactylos carnosus]CAF3509249.1 unnamed protein product [Didymodactylos carnosus]
MYMIDKMRKQLKYLISIFFTTTHTTNKNSENYDLIRSILCAGLYPNIARIHLSYKNSSKRPIILETKFDHRVLLHPRSVNSKLRDNDIRTSKTPSIYVIYHEKVRTNATYIHDASLISPYALLFFGKSIQTKDGVLIDDWINININHKSFKIVDELKIKFDYLLEQKASKKSIQLDYEHQLIDTIIQIITKQDRNIGIVEQKE